MRNKFKSKITILLCFLLVIHSCISKQHENQKEEALSLLKKVGEAVTGPSKKSFNLIIDEEKLTKDSDVVSQRTTCEIKAVRPNKLFVESKSETSNFEYLYDGEYFTYYSKNENNYVTLHAPETTVAMIDSMHNGFGFKFPGSDFFYPSIHEDIEEFFPDIHVKEEERIEGTTCTKIIAQNDNVDVGIWISNKTSLPRKFEVVYKKQKNIKYQAVFQDWNLSPSFNDTIFCFVAPEDASLVDIMSME